MRIAVPAASVALAMTGIALGASPAAATCIDYYQQEVAHTDFNGDGRKEIVAYYPPIPTDVDPADCLRTEPEPPRFVGVDQYAVIALLDVGTS